MKWFFSIWLGTMVILVILFGIMIYDTTGSLGGGEGVVIAKYRESYMAGRVFGVNNKIEVRIDESTGSGSFSKSKWDSYDIGDNVSINYRQSRLSNNFFYIHSISKK